MTINVAYGWTHLYASVYIKAYVEESVNTIIHIWKCVDEYCKTLMINADAHYYWTSDHIDEYYWTSDHIDE